VGVECCNCFHFPISRRELVFRRNELEINIIILVLSHYFSAGNLHNLQVVLQSMDCIFIFLVKRRGSS
jgi:hypothetical protein